MYYPKSGGREAEAHHTKLRGRQAEGVWTIWVEVRKGGNIFLVFSFVFVVSCCSSRDPVRKVEGGEKEYVPEKDRLPVSPKYDRATALQSINASKQQRATALLSERPSPRYLSPSSQTSSHTPFSACPPTPASSLSTCSTRSPPPCRLPPHHPPTRGPP